MIRVSFTSLHIRVWMEGYEAIDEMVARTSATFDEYMSETLERVRQRISTRHKYMLKACGDNEFEIENTGTAQQQKMINL